MRRGRPKYQSLRGTPSATESPAQLAWIPKGPSDPPVVTFSPHRPLLRSSSGCTREVLFQALAAKTGWVGLGGCDRFLSFLQVALGVGVAGKAWGPQIPQWQPGDHFWMSTLGHPQLGSLPSLSATPTPACSPEPNARTFYLLYLFAEVGLEIPEFRHSYTPPRPPCPPLRSLNSALINGN